MKCGCKIVYFSPPNTHRGEDIIEFCPLHSAAGELLEAAKELLELLQAYYPTVGGKPSIKLADAITKTEERKA